MKKRFLHHAFVVAVLSAGFTHLAHAQEGPGPRRISMEAFEACKGKEAGESCSFSDPEGKARTGACKLPAADANGLGDDHIMNRKQGAKAMASGGRSAFCLPARGEAGK